jgi:protease-4
MGSIIAGIWNGLSWIRVFVLNLIFLVFIGIIVASVFSSSEIALVPDSSALIINPTGTIVEQKRPVDPLAGILNTGSSQYESETLLSDLLDAIQQASTDQRIKIIVLETDSLQGASFAQLSDIGAALDEFKAMGKSVYAWSDGYTQNQYFLASHADKIYLNAQSFQVFGGVFMTGLGVYPTFYQEALEKLKVTLHVFKVGTYKGAVEPFMRNDMSPESQEANLAWLNVLWDDYAKNITERRNISRAEFDQYISEYDTLLAEAAGDAPLLAVQRKLIDERVSPQQWTEHLQDIVGTDGSDFNQINFHQYLATTRLSMPKRNLVADKIAIIKAKGTIYDGYQPDGNIGGDSLSELIKTAREDSTVKALVLRVDSPGGSASASEKIRYELSLFQATGKPVVVSMGSYAASGGYWISATANKIFASKNTVTGSIGTFMIFPTFEQSFAELGIHTDGVGTTPLADAMNPFKAINPIMKHTFELSIRNTYAKFISLVADGRGMTVQEVDAIAQGRVWAGSTALELGLIDGIGSLDDAIESAATLAAVNDYEVLHFEKELSPKELFLKEVMNSKAMAELITTVSLNIDTGLIQRITSEMEPLIRMSQKPGVYLHCLACKVQ